LLIIVVCKRKNFIYGCEKAFTLSYYGYKCGFCIGAGKRNR